MRRREVGLAVYVVLTAALVWSSTTLLMGVQNPLKELRGAIDCNCNDCNEDSHVFNECWHVIDPCNLDPNDPNGTAPEPPTAGDPNNPHSDSNNKKCSPDYCIRNEVWYAECPEDANGAACPVETDNSQNWAEQEIRTGGAAAGCGSPDYTVYDPFPQSDCKIANSSITVPFRAACSVGSCGGQTLDHMYDHDGDPNTPEISWYDPNREGRTVCK